MRSNAQPVSGRSFVKSPHCVHQHFLTLILVIRRVHRSREAGACPGHLVRGVQEQKMGVQLERERARAHHVQVSGTVRRTEEVAHSQGGAVPIPKPVPVRKRWFPGERDTVLLTNSGRAHGGGAGTVSAGSHRH
jgi:hypothetical protein